MAVKIVKSLLTHIMRVRRCVEQGVSPLVRGSTRAIAAVRVGKAKTGNEHLFVAAGRRFAPGLGGGR